MSALVGEAVQSVLDQTYPRLEVIVVDDGSTDTTLEVLKSFSDDRLTVSTGSNLGAAGARNKGLNQASGELVAFLDADDRWDREKLEIQVAWLMERPDVVALGSPMRYISSRGKVLGTSAGKPLSDGDRRMVAEARGMPFPLSSAVIRRADLLAVEGFDESLAEIRGQVEDLDLLSRVSDRGKIECLPQVLGSYRIHGNSASSKNLASQRAGTRFLEQRRVAERGGRTLTWAEFSAGYRPSARERRLVRANAAYRAAGLAVADGKWISAVRNATIATLAAPRFTFNRLMRQKPWTG